MSAADRLSQLFELSPEQGAELEQLATDIHQNHDLGVEWRPWWPRVDEVWRFKGRPPQAMPESHRDFHREAWLVLERVWLDYQEARA